MPVRGRPPRPRPLRFSKASGSESTIEAPARRGLFAFGTCSDTPFGPGVNPPPYTGLTLTRILLEFGEQDIYTSHSPSNDRISV